MATQTLQVIPGGLASPLTDEALVRRHLHDDPRAFEALVLRHQELVLKVVRRFSRSPEDAKDLAQRAFLKAFESMEQLQSVPFKAWLLRVAVNLGKNTVRDLARWPSAPVESIEGQHSSPGAQAALESAQAASQLRAAVLELPHRQREVFALRIDAELSFSEVGEALGITETNAKAHFHLALKRLREQLHRGAP